MIFSANAWFRSNSFSLLHLLLARNTLVLLLFLFWAVFNFFSCSFCGICWASSSIGVSSCSPFVSWSILASSPPSGMISTPMILSHCTDSWRMGNLQLRSAQCYSDCGGCHHIMVTAGACSLLVSKLNGDSHGFWHGTPAPGRWRTSP